MTAAAPRRERLQPNVPVHFFIVPAGISLERARTLDPDLDWRDLRRGKEVWIVQTWHRLRAAGYPVTMGSDVPRTGLVVFHKEEQRLILRRMPADATPVLVAARGDFRSADAADFEILQNGYFADGRRRFFMPHWLQPGLLPRDPARGTRVERIAFKGFIGNLADELRGARFRGFLAHHGLTFEEHLVVDEEWTHPIEPAWHDYTNVDVVLAIRPPAAHGYRHKPPSKLCNAWHAGVPAVLGPDYAFREQRRNALDYLEARSADEVQEAILRLRRDPHLYLAMVQNGFERAREFSVERVTAQWATLLFETLPALAASRPPSYYAPGARRARTLARKVTAVLRASPRK